MADLSENSPSSSRIDQQREQSSQSSRAEDIAKAKDNFLAVVSHDLRTPLAAIKVSLELLQEEGKDTISPEIYRKLLENMAHGVERLEKLVANVADIAALETSPFNLVTQPVAAVDVVTAAVGMMSVLMHHKQQSIEVAIEHNLPTFQADASHLEQVLVNLLSNANKYSPPGAKIQVKASHQGDEIVFEVSDNGPGISAEVQEKLFTPFFGITDKASRRSTGWGFGLRIVSYLVALHGGHVWVKSEIGRGSSFFFALPIRRAL